MTKEENLYLLIWDAAFEWPQECPPQSVVVVTIQAESESGRYWKITKKDKSGVWSIALDEEYRDSGSLQQCIEYAEWAEGRIRGKRRLSRK